MQARYDAALAKLEADGIQIVLATANEEAMKAEADAAEALQKAEAAEEVAQKLEQAAADAVAAGATVNGVAGGGSLTQDATDVGTNTAASGGTPADAGEAAKTAALNGGATTAAPR